MYLIVSHQLNSYFSEKCKFDNKSRYDSPLYNESLSVFKGNCVRRDKGFEFVGDLVFEGYLPFANIHVSNKSEHAILRKETIQEYLCVGVCGMYKVLTEWKHKAFFLFNKDILNDPKVKFVENETNFKFSKNVAKLVKEGLYRTLSCNVVNPIWKGKYFSGVNIHRGPKFNKGDWNYSLGCITVEAGSFDIFMNTVDIDDICIYLHNIENIINNKNAKDDIKRISYNSIDVDTIYGVINSHIEEMKI